MHPARFTLRLTYCAWGAAAAALIGLVGCTLVGDSLTGVSVTDSDPTTCVKECNDFYRLQFTAEQKRHLEEVEKCQELSQPDKDACLAAEGERHSAAMDALGTAKIGCQNDCHRQGQGSAG